ncbi:MAG: hypothetical protein CM15mP120_25680 [Pseudomonadota bacterium]|nr:MAG: hypothetical protein CM15mP120_25680 [Pseudomonadota bacterium]
MLRRHPIGDSIILVYLQWAQSTIGRMIIVCFALCTTQCESLSVAATREDHKLDIKEIILIVGGLLIVAIIGHGLWVKHSRRNRLRMDISPKSFSEADAESAEEEPSVRGELPNGGARIVRLKRVPPRQDSLQLEVDPQRTSRETQHRQNLERQARGKSDSLWTTKTTARSR